MREAPPKGEGQKPAAISPAVPAQATEAPGPTSIEGEILSMRDLDVVSLREGADVDPAPSAAPAAKGAAPPAIKAKAPPAKSEPPVRDGLVPPSLRSKDASAHLPFFDVDTAPSAARVPPPKDEISVEERGPDSGLIDIRGMVSLEEKAKSEERVDADLFNLSGGLFGSTPIVPLTPPDIHALTGAPESGRSSGAGRPPASARVAPVLMPSSGPLTERRRQLTVDLSAAKRSARAGWIVALVSAGAALILLALKLGANVGASESATPDSTATAASAEATPPREMSAPSAMARPGAEPGALKAPSSAASSAPASGRADKPGSSPSVAPRAAGPSGPAAAAGASPPKGGAGPATTPVATAAPAKPEEAAGADFDVSAARAALAVAAGKASGCKQPDDPGGGAKVSVTFAPSGRVTSARVTGPPFQGTPTGGCIASAFRGATVPPFGGSSVTVTKEVSIR
jgi:hypothetical protein